MSCSVVLLFVLLLSVATARVLDTSQLRAQDVSPKRFACKLDSPVSKPVFSRTTPRVALTHIFCGQINRRGEAEGFHSRPGNRSPKCAKISRSATHNDGKQKHRKENPYCMNKLAIFDKRIGRWINRKSMAGGYSFFPTKWTVKNTVDEIIKMYDYCKQEGRIEGTTSTLYISNYKYRNWKPFDVTIFLNGEKDIVSAFPTGCPTRQHNKNLKLNMSCHT